MPRRVPLPPALLRRPFSVGAGSDAGLSDDRMLSSDLTRPFRGVRSAQRSTSTIETLCAAYATRMTDAQYFSHLTAARLWHLPVPLPFDASELVHVATSVRGSRIRCRGVIEHQLASRQNRIMQLGRVRVSDPVSTWMQLASILSVDDLVAVGDALVLDPIYPDREAPAARPYSTPEELRRRLCAFRGPGRRRLLAALEHVRPGVESPKETELRLLLVRVGLPEPRVNVFIHGTRARFVPRVDLVYAEWKVLVEYDGEQHRTDAERYARDRQRAADLREAGYVLVTVLKGGLAGAAGRGETVAEVRRALLAAGWRP